MQLVARLEVADDAVQVVQRDLADDHAVVVLVDDAADPAQPVVDRVPVLVVAPRRAGVVAQQRVLGDLGDRVEPEAVDAAVEPEAQHVVHRRLDLGVLPVEVGLLGHERVQVVLAGALVERPRGAAGLERRGPVVGRAAVRRRVAPDVPVALGVLAARARLLEPRVAVGRVVRDPVDHDADVAGVALGDELVEVRQRAEHRVDVAVVGRRRSRSRPSATGRTATARSP